MSQRVKRMGRAWSEEAGTLIDGFMHDSLERVTRKAPAVEQILLAECRITCCVHCDSGKDTRWI